ncbi:helix-turn-helix domain-containing protein [Arcticibacter svalbardensis]|uniref:helix-turn-helix domain-containing protein n=1 Tax=Arcticibacter svalbardensis TaxID=1288027 RepID=UPI00058B966D|nr:helix-turn-helix domain-containing protein [Arcticibacter svalbardensis]
MCICKDDLIEELNKLFDAKADEYFKRLYDKQSIKETNDLGNLMTVDEVLNCFEISRTALYAWIKQGKIDSLKVGNQRLFNRKHIENYKNYKLCYYGKRTRIR